MTSNEKMVSRSKEYHQVKLVKKNQSDNSTSLLIWILSVCIAIYYYCYCCYCYHTWRHGARILVFFVLSVSTSHIITSTNFDYTRSIYGYDDDDDFFSLSAAFYTAGFKINFLFHFKQKMYESYHHNEMNWWFEWMNTLYAYLITCDDWITLNCEYHHFIEFQYITVAPSVF